MQVKSFFVILLAMQLSVGMVAPSAIGIASAKGNFRIDNAAIAGNGTLFDGVIVETQRATGQLELNNGARLQLGINTRGKVFSNRLILEQGETPVPFRAIRANSASKPEPCASYRPIPPQWHTSAWSAPSRVHVSALRGSLRVTNAGGVVVRRVGGRQRPRIRAAGRRLGALQTDGLCGEQGWTLLPDRRDIGHYRRIARCRSRQASREQSGNRRVPVAWALRPPSPITITPAK